MVYREIEVRFLRTLNFSASVCSKTLHRKELLNTVGCLFLVTVRIINYEIESRAALELQTPQNT